MSKVASHHNRQCILVLGMHRSGTSAVAKMMNMLGASLPKTILPAGQGNEVGHWEPENIVKLNDKLLAELGSSWDDWRSFDFDKLPSETKENYSNELSQLIQQDFEGAELFVLKDPRICRLAEIYIDIFKQLNINTKIILPFRHPEAVSASLLKRNNIPAKVTHLYWLRHVLDAEKISRDFPRIICSYENILKDWKPFYTRLNEDLDLGLEKASDTKAAELSDFLDPSLQNFATESEDKPDREPLNAWVEDTYNALKELELDPLNTIQIEVLDRVAKELNHATGIFGEHLHHLKLETGALIAQQDSLSNQVTAYHVDRDHIKNQKEILQNQNGILQGQHDALRGEHKTLQEQHEILQNHDDALQSEIVELQKALHDSIQESTKNLTALQYTQSRLTDTLNGLNEAEAKNVLLTSKMIRVESKTQHYEKSLGGKAIKRLSAFKITKNLVSDNASRQLLLASSLFDPDWYRSAYSDIADQGVDPAKHYLEHGAEEGRHPSPEFDSQRYLVENPDLAEEGMNPLLHFLKFGENEGRIFHPLDSVSPDELNDRKLIGSNSPIKLKLDFLNQIKPSQNSSSNRCWEMYGEDPHFIMSPTQGAIPAGHYLLRADSSDLGTINQKQKIYLDYGEGFQEEKSISICPQASKNGWKVSFKFERPVHKIRLDPSEHAGNLNIGKLTLRSISSKRHALLMVNGLMKERVNSPTDLAQNFKKARTSIARGGIKQLMADLATASSLRSSVTEYATWVQLYDQISETDALAIKKRIKSLKVLPKISIAVPVYNPPPAMLSEAIDSVLEQLYPNWELCLANDCSTDPEVAEVLDQYAAKDDRIKVVHRPENGHISKATNSALEIATGEWVALLDHDDRLTPHALYCIVEAMLKNPQGRLFYSDEDKIDMNGVRHDPYFKCDWNPDLFLSHNLITHLGVYQKERLDEINGFRTGIEGAQDYDLAMRFTEGLQDDEIVHIPHILYHWRVMPGSTAMSSDEKPYAMIAGERALNDHLKRRNIEAEAELIGFGYKIKYALPEKPPLVSLVIPTRNAHELVKQCVDSIFDLTTYPNYEIVLVDNGSDEAESLAYFAELDKDSRVNVLRDDRPFNYSALNNNAVKHAKGEVIALVNNDITVITPDWLEEMVSKALQPGVGAVGAMLYYPNDTIQHAGVVMGLGGLAAHIHGEFPRGTAGYVGRAALTQTLSAVTAACLVVQKKHFNAVDGLNENDLTVAYNDVDFCLKLRASGLRNIWTPHAELYHHESATRGYEISPEKQARFDKEKKYMLKNWGDVITHDPAYSPNLTLDNAKFSLAFPPRINKPWLVV